MYYTYLQVLIQVTVKQKLINGMCARARARVIL